MKIILLRDVLNLGKAGEIKIVSNGYGKNYLIPQGLAMLATSSLVRDWEQKQVKLKREQQESIKEALTTKEKIDALEMKQNLAASQQGEAFGSVRKEDIVEFLKAHDILVSKSAILLEQPIKKEGKYDISILLSENLSATLKVNLALSRQP